MFLPVNYPQAVSLRKVNSRRFALVLAALLLLSTLGTILALLYVPWWQSVGGSGRVTVFSPSQRAQEIDAQIPGRIVQWYVQEGSVVRKGQKLALLQDVDSKFLDPQQAARQEQMLQAYQRKLQAGRARLQVIGEQRAALLQGRSAALPAARRRVEQSQARLQQAKQTLLVSEQNLETDTLQLDRLRMLEQEGLRSRRDLELAQQAAVRSRTELARNQAAQDVSSRDIDIARLEMDRLVASFDAELAKVSDTLLKAQEELAETEAACLKLQVELSTTLRRNLQQEVLAPGDGRVVRLLRVGAAETVKAGDPLCTLMPAQQDPAVELYIGDFDAPLVRTGQRVRLLFDGFPGVPFTAFPWSAIGTFAGKVAVVDASDDGTGRYRVLVVPDKTDQGVPWPAGDERQTRFPLRPGTQAQGWIIMDRPVPLYWEVWRRLNAFPPVPMADSAEKGEKGEKSEKAEKQHQPKAVLKR
jgi:membrane fusion protein, adhesin transport system